MAGQSEETLVLELDRCGYCYPFVRDHFISDSNSVYLLHGPPGSGEAGALTASLCLLLSSRDVSLHL